MMSTAITPAPSAFLTLPRRIAQARLFTRAALAVSVFGAGGVLAQEEASAPAPVPSDEQTQAAGDSVEATGAEPALAAPASEPPTENASAQAPEEAPPPVEDPRAPTATIAPAEEDTGGYETTAPSTAALVTESRAVSDGTRTMLAYVTSMPVGATYDFVSQYSFAGFSFDWRTRVTEKLWGGVSVGWQVLYNKEIRTSEVGDVALTGTQIRHLNNFPILLTGHYYLNNEDGKLQPYAGLGVGAYVSERRVDVGLLATSNVAWHFGFAPEIGIALPAGRNRLFLASRFNYAFESGGNPELMYFNFSFGVELQ